MNPIIKKDTGVKKGVIKKAIKYLFIILLVVVLPAVLMKNMDKIYSTIFKGKKAAEATTKTLQLEPEGAVIPVKAFKSKRTYFKDTLPVLGTIRGFKEIDLKFEVNGVMESFNFEEGEKVSEGDIIANLKQKDALLKLEYARLQMEKNQKLLEIGAIVKSEFEKTRLEYESAKSDFEKTNLYAPRAGLLGKKYAEEGEYLIPNDRVTTFVDLGSVYAEFGIIEKDMAKVAIGQQAEVFVDAYPGKSYKGTVDQIAPILEGKSRTQSLKIKLENPQTELKPGMFARGIIATYEEKNALIVPTSGVKKTDQGYFVYVIHKTENLEEEKNPKEESAEEVEGKENAKEVKEGENEKSPKDVENTEQAGGVGGEEGDKIESKDAKAGDLAQFGKDIAENLGIGGEGEKGAGKEEAKKEEEKAPEAGQIEVRQVAVKYMAPDYTEIGEGLEEGELVAVEVREELKNGSKVEISEVLEAPF
ncbi:MAG: hypothetical protein COS99_05595 [Candidatus Omnitrophica bacterium CG07_land_8_20_14_0_80_42_15]|uniref:CusB-like beta-barrel domain-containing protein n=1 Tax=Candidatus Aquitaenariimonas noxiae TaxID=1974741 RepID=A0A2J0KSA1_9BACT|nr:MAG: hypothetical protein COS99_05595 [Candidatus Omnitrophica bacterium CG07_land_8_20_14_0_80_42_15]